MKAKDIVFKECERQAKFGYEPSWEDFVIAGQKAGIREVVEWIEENAYPPAAYRNIRRFRYDDWQAKLKEWGIEDA